MSRGIFHIEILRNGTSERSSTLTAGRWNFISSLAIVSGALVWLVKFATIFASAGEETDSGMPAMFYVLGLLLMAGGLAGIAVGLTRHRPMIARIFAGLSAAAAFVATFLALDFLVRPLVPGNWPAYVGDEVSIVLTAAAWLAIGLGLMFKSRRVARLA